MLSEQSMKITKMSFADVLLRNLWRVGKNPEAISKIDHTKDITAWIYRIQEIKGIVEDPIIIGHRENGLLALQLMQNNHWKRGILLCCGLHYNYFPYSYSVKKPLIYLLQDLTDDYSLIQIETGLSGSRINRKENTSKLQCAHRIHMIENMDDTLRYHNIREKVNSEHYDNILLRKRRGLGDGLIGKGYRIKCGTGVFPPVCEELIEVLKAEIDMIGGFA